MFTMTKGSRTAIVAFVLVLLLSMTAMAGAKPAVPPERSGGPQVENVILFVGDGMHLQHEIAASRYLTGHDTKLGFHRFPYRADVATWDVSTYDGYVRTGWFEGAELFDPAAPINPLVGYDASRGGEQPYPLSDVPDEDYFLTIDDKLGRWIATDSASSATSMSAGIKTDDGRLAWAPAAAEDPGPVTTIVEHLQEERDFATGVVSTVQLPHATPAAFVAHHTARWEYREIMDEILTETRPDVVIGSGHPCPDGVAAGCSYDFISEELYEDMKDDEDYVFVEREPSVDGGQSIRAGAVEAVADGKKLFGLFGDPDKFDPPMPAHSPGSPHIDPGAKEDPLLRDATRAALDVLSADEDGFFLMVEQGDLDWANHDNDYEWMIGTTWDLDQAVEEAVQYVARPDNDMNWANTLLIVTSDHANSYMRLTGDPVLGKGELPDPDSWEGEVGGWYEGEGVTYQTDHHTNELVRLYARGASASHFKNYEGAWYPGTDIIDNTQIYLTMMEVLGETVESPYEVVIPDAPMTKDDCRNGGWEDFGFKSQGQCISSLK